MKKKKRNQWSHVGQWQSFFFLTFHFSNLTTASCRTEHTSLLLLHLPAHWTVFAYNEQKNGENLRRASEQAGITWQKSLVRHFMEP